MHQLILLLNLHGQRVREIEMNAAFLCIKSASRFGKKIGGVWIDWEAFPAVFPVLVASNSHCLPVLYLIYLVFWQLGLMWSIFLRQKWCIPATYVASNEKCSLEVTDRGLAFFWTWWKEGRLPWTSDLLPSFSSYLHIFTLHQVSLCYSCTILMFIFNYWCLFIMYITWVAVSSSSQYIGMQFSGRSLRIEIHALVSQPNFPTYIIFACCF